jgi:hypothetical protein
VEAWFWYIGLSIGVVVVWWVLQRGARSLGDDRR